MRCLGCPPCRISGARGRQSGAHQGAFCLRPVLATKQRKQQKRRAKQQSNASTNFPRHSCSGKCFRSSEDAQSLSRTTSGSARSCPVAIRQLTKTGSVLLLCEPEDRLGSPKLMGKMSETKANLIVSLQNEINLTETETNHVEVGNH